MTTPGPPVACPLAQPPNCCQTTTTTTPPPPSCCDFDVQYVGKTVTITLVRSDSTSTNITESTETFTGTYTGGGNFAGTYTLSYRVCTRSDAGACNDAPTNCSPLVNDSYPAVLTMVCGIDGNGLYYGFQISLTSINSLDYRTPALLANCGYPVGCGGYFDNTCTASYVSSCFSVTAQQDVCTLNYTDEDCTTLFDTRWNTATLTMSIA
jgi:hypothetical protein